MQFDWGDVPAWATIGLSFAFSLGAFIVSLRGLKWQRKAAEAAIRSANSDEKVAALTEAAMTQQANPTRETGQGVSWSLERNKDRFALRNTGTEVATGVTVAGKDFDEVAVNPPIDAAVRPGASVSFFMAGSMAHALPDEIEVTWDGHPDPVILPVPPRG